MPAPIDGHLLPTQSFIAADQLAQRHSRPRGYDVITAEIGPPLREIAARAHKGTRRILRMNEIHLLLPRRKRETFSLCSNLRQHRQQFIAPIVFPIGIKQRQTDPLQTVRRFVEADNRVKCFL